MRLPATDLDKDLLDAIVWEHPNGRDHLLTMDWLQFINWAQPLMEPKVCKTCGHVDGKFYDKKFLSEVTRMSCLQRAEDTKCRNLRLKEIVARIAPRMQCNCDLDNWEPEPETGHSWVCRIHKQAKNEYADEVQRRKS